MQDWKSKTVIVLASGPSLTQEDIDRTSHLPCIAVNSTWEIVRHCTVLFAGDYAWWKRNGSRVDIKAARASLNTNAERQYQATAFKSKIAKKGGYNSGCVAIEYAIAHGADRVIMLGFDCSIKNGIHHHGAHHMAANPDAKKCLLWKSQFQKLRDQYPKADIVNCSRYTELEMFPRMELECGLG